MKVFLSSTAYDLIDIRAKVIAMLSQKGHEVIFHESPTFPAKIDLHSHDQCILAVEECDTIVCILDKRYGGEYRGELLKDNNSVKITILGKDANGNKLRQKIEVPVNKMSITWCEINRAYSLNKNVITFSRQRTLDEKETRRHNQYLKTFRPAYAERNELFDLIDWITKQKRNNWIIPFNTVVDFEEKLETYINELEKLRLKTTVSKKYLKKKICIIVEGEIDRLVVQNLIRKSRIKGDFVIIPSYGKYRIVQNINEYIQPFADSFDHVIVLIDTDAKGFGQLNTFRENIIQLQENLVRNNVQIFGANPEIEAWIVAGLDENLYRQYEGFIQKEIFTEIFGNSTIENTRQLMRKYNVSQAISLSPELADFLGVLRQFEKDKNEIKHNP
jgi:5S rRNA maturation endonuclease (ribonuclease M5)